MANYAVIDRSEFPLVLVTFTGATETQENFDEYLQGLSNNYESKQALSLVFDATNAPLPNPVYQMKQAKWMKENDSTIREYCRGVAYVMPNAILRQTLKLIFAIQPMPVTFKVFATIEEGVDWAKGQLD